MRWRKQDYTLQERKGEQHLGFVTCLGANLTLLVVWLLLANATGFDPAAAGTGTEIFLLALPWVVNIGILAVALTFRPQFAVGYLAFFATIIIGTIVLGTLFVAACFASIVTMAVLSPLGDAGLYVAFYCVLPVVFFGALYYLGKAFLPLFSRWWSRE